MESSISIITVTDTNVSLLSMMGGCPCLGLSRNSLISSSTPGWSSMGFGKALLGFP